MSCDLYRNSPISDRRWSSNAKMPAMSPEIKMTLTIVSRANINSVHQALEATAKLKAAGSDRIEPAMTESARAAMPGQKPPQAPRG
jgi:hypothetical protein